VRASSSNPDASAGRASLWPYALFVLSGFAALVLEAVFLRQLAWLVGNSAVATSIVLAAFMAGLALGAALFGRFADRSSRPLRLFGLLELGTALAGLALVTLLGTGRELFLAPLRLLESGTAQRGLESVLAFSLLLLPTVLMGGTLPALSRALIRDMGRFVGSLGWLYALNTLGAAAGVFVAGFYLFELLGVSRSAWVALALQVGVGLTALLLDRRLGPVDSGETPVHEPPAESSPANARRACLVAATVGGFAVLGYEVAWTRLLSLFMRSFSYSFSLMLGLFLFGLFLGALLLALVGHRIAQPARLVGWLQVAMGLYVATSLFWLAEYVAPVGASSFTEFLWRSTLKAVPVVLPPTLLSGMVLPLAARGFARNLGRVGADVGLVYGLNTAGAILGALLTGLVLLPRLGAPAALALLALLNAAAGAFLLLRLPGRRLQAAVALALAALCALPLAQGNERFVRAFLRATRNADKIGELLFFHEGATDTVAIVRKQYGFHDPQAKSLITNGVAMSATVKPVWRYMAAEGHLPLLLAARPDDALVIGVGTGITLSAVVSHPEVRSITAVELSDGVARGLEHFRDENAGSYLDPRVALLREDGRHFLELTPDRFDVITLEPPPPIVAGSVHLYSLDFYRLCSSRLNEGGAVAQWLPLHAQSLASARMSARTFLEAFPHVTLWLPSGRGVPGDARGAVGYAVPGPSGHRGLGRRRSADHRRAPAHGVLPPPGGQHARCGHRHAAGPAPGRVGPRRGPGRTIRATAARGAREPRTAPLLSRRLER